ncbi:MAG: pectinesterase family protein [Myxococcota bacterium]|nr:pectinesterase family protein [Myxococcota bacterium]
MRNRRLSVVLVSLCLLAEAAVAACGGDTKAPAGGSGNSGSTSGSGSGGVGSGSSGASSGTASGAASSSGASGSTTGASGATSGAAGSGDASAGTSGAAATSGSAASGDAGMASSGATLGNDAAPLPADGGLASAAPLTGLLGAATRPQMSATQAAEFTIANYLAQTGTIGSLTADNWNPTAGLDVTTLTPTYTVGPTGAMYTTVQAAIDAAAAGAQRVLIQIAPGVYNEQLCIKATAPPITLYSTNVDATKTVLQHADSQSGLATMGINPCGGDTNQQAATLAAFNKGFQAKNLTIQNTYVDTGSSPDGGPSAPQAVALATTGDQVILDNVRIISHQDTLYVDRAKPPPSTVSRVYVKNSYVAGDVDFIFGAATAVFDHCQIDFLSDRHPAGGQPLAPDTGSDAPYGFLVINSAFTADANTAAGILGLGRAWDHSCGKTADLYVTSCVATPPYPNGQATVMSSTIDAHYSRTKPWVSAATTSRGYSSVPWACAAAGMCPANRLYEYANSGPGSASGM